jgi:outer membrane protein assembly factor BamB
MKRLFLFSALCIIIGAAIPRKPIAYSSSIKEHWKAKIGFTSYRTIPVVANGKILIGSNGSHFRDYAIDNGNGVFGLNSKNGKVEFNFAGEQFGDMDVNGILHLGELNYFGNDNEEFQCVDDKGTLKWRALAGGDVEHTAVALKKGTEEMVVFATETGQVQALNALTGKIIWSYYHANYNGWKPGDNRTIFKVKMHFSEQNSFFNEPNLSDLTNDGVKDLIYNANWGDFVAINGATGKLLWTIDNQDHPSYYINMGREKPLIVGEGANSQIVLLLRDKEDYYKQAIAFYNAKGKLMKIVNVKNNIGYPLISQTRDYLLTNTSIIKPGTHPADVNVISIDSAYFKNDDGKLVSRFGDGQAAQKKILYNKEECALVVYQYDAAMKSNMSPILLIGLKTGKIHYRANLPARSEFTPFIADNNNDGKLDVLIGCYDEYLYCFDLGISVSQLID